MAVATDESQCLSRKEAAKYLSLKYHRISAGTLARYATQGIGPLFHYSLPGRKGIVLYPRTELDAWWRTLSELGARARAPAPRKPKLPPLPRRRSALAPA